ncbi:MAG: porin [Cellvibrionaceae bacterium]
MKPAKTIVFKACTLAAVIGALTPAVTTTAFAGEVKSKGADLVLDTTGGLKISTADNRYSFKLGGRIQWDYDTYDGALTADGDRKKGGDLRRARLELGGTIDHDWQYVFSVNVGQATDKDNSTNFSSVGIRYSGWDWGSVFVGRTKEPFGLEELTSSKAISTIERAYWVESTDVDSNMNYGVRLDGFTDYGLGWGASIGSPKGGPKDTDGNENLAVTGRVFFAPMSDFSHALHFGAAFTDRGISDPMTTSGFKLDIAEHGGKLDSRSIDIKDDTQFGLEALYINGPLSFQTEYFRRDLAGAGSGPDGEVDAYYLQVTYTLTGETRGYKKKKGYTGGIKPSSDQGAWELVGKYDSISFDQDGFSEEEAKGFLLGANYYPNKHLKFMVNYIHFESDNVASTAGRDDDADVLSLRMQLAF